MNTPETVSKISSEVSSTMREARNNFSLHFALGTIKPQANTHWEEIKCIGYNPQLQRLEAIVNIKQSFGYNGGLCTNASREYVRFYIDFKDGGGFRDFGLTSFKAADISELPPGPQHPLSYMVYLNIDDAQYRRFIDCSQAVIPTMRAILSWNVVPTQNTPDYHPHYGNVCNADIQLKRRLLLKAKEVFDLVKKPELKMIIEPELQIPLAAPQPVNVKALYQAYKKVDIPDHRTFFSTIGATIHSPMNFSQAKLQFNVSELVALDIDVSKLTGIYNDLPNEKKANVSFEEVTCVGLNTDMNMLGAVVHIKKSNGYGGDLCHNGSVEHVAFWADWDNSGTYQYLNTVSFETHDIANIPDKGLYYNVALPFDVSGRLKPCETPNILRVRAVLSWEALPSTTNPNQLNTWGNSIDALVQLRPGRGSGVNAFIDFVGNAERALIDPTERLFNYTAVNPSKYNNRPWGGRVNFRGTIYHDGVNGTIRYRILYKPYGADDSVYLPVSTTETFKMRLWNQPSDDPFYVTQNADELGWYIYPANDRYEINHLLSNWQTDGLADGSYTIRFECTDESGPVQIGDEFSIIICNQGMSISKTANSSVDMTKDIDLVIDGGDCHCYDNQRHLIDGHLRAVHPYFAWWRLDLQPSSHTHHAVPSPIDRYYSTLGDIGDANTPWSLDTAPLDNCGYTISIEAYTRVILNNDGDFPGPYGPKAVGFSKQKQCIELS